MEREAAKALIGVSRILLSNSLFALALACCIPAARAQFPEAPEVPAAMVDSPALKPPTGSNVAIVEFDDLECPACAAANPTLMAAAKKYNVPWIRHDFLIPTHTWSRQAAINARWLDMKSKELGEAYRNAVFAAQQSISTPDDLSQFTQHFAEARHVQLPFAVDPQGKLADAVQDDVHLAHALGLRQTPTIFVVTEHAHSPGHPFVQMNDTSLLYAFLDQAVSATASAAPAHQPRSAK